MGLESLTELGIKTAFKVVTDALAPDKIPHYRCFFLDDRENAEVTEDKLFPYVRITASPNWPHGAGSTFRDIPVELQWATLKKTDPVCADLVAMYEACRTIIDTATNVTVTGYNVTGILIEQGGSVDIEDNEQSITLPIIVKVCGA